MTARGQDRLFLAKSTAKLGSEEEETCPQHCRCYL
jgi:hypothetical protein